jgi:predicted anti-sigma-YlaC factor YlaD
MEEHLLICSACRDRLKSTEQYAAAMNAAANIRENGADE